MPLKDILFSFKGRLRRRDWWLWSILMGIAYVATISVVGAVIYGTGWSSADYFADATIGVPVDVLALAIATHVPFLFIQTALAVKRAHDRDHPAWPAAAIMIVMALSSYLPADGYGIAGRAADQGDTWGTVILIVGIMTVVGSVYLLVVLGFMDGTQGPNRHGASPKGIGGDPLEETAEVFQ